MADRYWVGGNGTSWTATAPTNWSATDGGAGDASIPTSADNALFTSTFTGNVASGAGNVCLSLSFTGGTGYTGTWSGSDALTISGSLTLASTMTRTYTGAITFNSTASGNTITSNGISLGSNLTFNGVGGVWSTADALTANACTLTNGTLDVNANVSFLTFSSSNSNTRTLNMGSGTWTLRSNAGVVLWNTSNIANLTFNKETANFNITAGGTSDKTWNSGTLTFNNITLATSIGASNALIFTENQTFADFSITGTSQMIRFTAGTTTTITGTFTAVQTGTQIESPTAAQHTLSKSSGTVSVSNCTITQSAATGGARWQAYVGNGNVDGGSNSGWIFTEPPTVTTQAVSSIGATTATGNGNITDIGDANADERGFVWDTSTKSDPGFATPAASGYAFSVTESGSFGTGAFTGSLTGLSASTGYFVRAFAHNAGGYQYGGEVSFTSAAAGGAAPVIPTLSGFIGQRPKKKEEPRSTTFNEALQVISIIRK